VSGTNAQPPANNVYAPANDNVYAPANTVPVVVPNQDASNNAASAYVPLSSQPPVNNVYVPANDNVDAPVNQAPIIVPNQVASNAASAYDPLSSQPPVNNVYVPASQPPVVSGAVVNDGDPASTHAGQIPTPAIAQVQQAPNLPAPLPIQFDQNLPPNPCCTSSPNNAGGQNLRVAAGNPGNGWVDVEQFCAFLATQWLVNGYSAGGLSFSNLSVPVKKMAVNI
jgi:hypothetical protein